MDKEQTVLEVYKIYVDAALRLIHLRHSTNRFNMAITSGLVAAAWILFNHGSLSPTAKAYVIVIPAILLGVIGKTWKNNLVHYRKLSCAKFGQIYEMEKGFPFKPFHEEWKIMNPNGENKAALSTWEELVPKCCAFLFWPAIALFILTTIVAFTNRGLLQTLFG